MATILDSADVGLNPFFSFLLEINSMWTLQEIGFNSVGLFDIECFIMISMVEISFLFIKVNTFFIHFPHYTSNVIENLEKSG